MENIQQNREVYGKKGAVIKFNNNVVENKDTNIIVRTLIDYKTSEKVNIFILRYTINQIPNTTSYGIWFIMYLNINIFTFSEVL